MAELYRKSALEKISSPEQLDKAMKVTSPLSWIGLIGISLIIIITIVWSIIGEIPVTVTTNGIIASPVGTNAVYTGNAGTIVAVNVSPGDKIYLEDEVAVLKLSDGSEYKIKSDQVGTVSKVNVSVGDTVNQSATVLQISPYVEGRQVVVCYVKMADAKKISRGMPVYVYLNSADSQTYGHMEARVINIDSYATTINSMNNVIGEENNLSSAFTNDGAVAAVTCELYTSKETESGLYWSNEKGKKLEVTNGSLVSAKIITEEVPPIAKLFTKLKEIWGD